MRAVCDGRARAATASANVATLLEKYKNACVVCERKHIHQDVFFVFRMAITGYSHREGLMRCGPLTRRKKTRGLSLGLRTSLGTPRSPLFTRVRPYGSFFPSSFWTSFLSFFLSSTRLTSLILSFLGCANYWLWVDNKGERGDTRRGFAGGVGRGDRDWEEDDNSVGTYSLTGWGSCVVSSLNVQNCVHRSTEFVMLAQPRS